MLKNFRFALLQHQESKQIQIVFFGYSFVLFILSIFSPLHLFFFLFKKDYRNLMIFVFIQLVFIYVINYWLLPLFFANQSAGNYRLIILLLNCIIPIIVLLLSFRYNSSMLKRYFNNNYKIIGGNKINIEDFAEYKAIVNYNLQEQKHFVKKYIINGCIKVSIIIIFVILLLVLNSRSY
jgi:hypothetical protein